MLVLADAAGDQDLFKLVIDYHRDRDWDRIITLNQEQTLREFATPCYLAFMHRWSYCGTYGLRIKDDKECGSGCIAKTLWSFAHEIWENYRDCRATSPYMVISKGTIIWTLSPCAQMSSCLCDMSFTFSPMSTSWSTQHWRLVPQQHVLLALY